MDNNHKYKIILKINHYKVNQAAKNNNHNRVNNNLNNNQHYLLMYKIVQMIRITINHNLYKYNNFH